MSKFLTMQGSQQFTAAGIEPGIAAGEAVTLSYYIKIYKTSILSVVLYGSEIWAFT